MNVKTHHHSPAEASTSCSSFVDRPRSVRFDYEDANEGRARFERAFTLIELLMVIGIIAILAGMVVVGAVGVQRKALVKRVQAQLAQVETAIDRYQIDNGYYPPDNSGLNGLAEIDVYFNDNTPASTNSLYYELSGVVFDSKNTPALADDEYIATDGAEIPKAAFEDEFNVGGVLNASRPGGGSAAKNYIQNFKTTQYSTLTGDIRVLSTSAEGPLKVGRGDSPFCYVSSRPTRNPKSIDLWVDIEVGNKTMRISNWSDEPEVLSE